jgi:ABC-type microcin C transport system duplicated ATPase subunit YejF
MHLIQGGKKMSEALLKVRNLTVAFHQTESVIDGINFDVYPGETFALVGESGSGKSLTALSVMRLLPGNANICGDEISLVGENILTLPEAEVCKIRGRRIAMIFQDPMTSLNPVMSIGSQVAEVIQLHFGLSKWEARFKTLKLLQQVEIPEPGNQYDQYPHQLSGGQRQRVMIAIALAGEPQLLIADEPTTALDVTIQAQILQLLKKIQQQTGMSLWLISHDLALVSNVADRIAVMQHGKIVETGEVANFFSAPKHEYTRKLLACLPSMDSCLLQKDKINPALLQVENFKVYYPVRKGFFKRVVDYVHAVDGVSFQLQQGKTLALVGESGCGKTTLGKGLLNLIDSHAGSVKLDGVELNKLKGEALRKKRAEIQIVFQDPYSSMNPRMLVGEIIAEGLRALHPDLSGETRQQKVKTLLRQVDLPEESAERYAHEFSGGQRQRICIARALAVEPKLIVCDEPTSALDVSVQAQIIQLLKQLQKTHKISYLFITHDLAVVSEIADEVAVMYQGKIIEQGTTKKILKQPEHAYTKKLLQAVPVLQAAPVV